MWRETLNNNDYDNNINNTDGDDNDDNNNDNDGDVNGDEDEDDFWYQMQLCHLNSPYLRRIHNVL